ncbi:uncharacterized protein LOC143882796 [Tasmannia lanceolata]|uniref:uncharacterized protein LOC143882796 n=1 Tax=Tasmannia lanceolata TaxID=3420 RepID=UPI00406390C9
METCLILPQRFSLTTPNRKVGFCHKKRFRPQTGVFAVKSDPYDRNFGGRSVDEDMIVLRKRIHEMKMVERNYEPPHDWMDWEKRYYTCYDSDVCEAVGLLQTLLMNTRPSLAIGMMVLVASSVPISVYMIVSHLIEASKGIF